MFIGIEGIARKVTGAHIGVDGVARRVKKAYIGVDGVARLAWEAGGGSGGGESSGVRAYLYGGVKLPELPDKGMPYALMELDTNEKYHVWFCSEPIHTSNIGVLLVPGGSAGYHYLVSDDGKAWELHEDWGMADSTYESPFAWPNNAVWANYDVLEKDGTTVRLAASDPVPLYSYNGVELPESPVEVKSYPYTVIFQDPADADFANYCWAFGFSAKPASWKKTIVSFDYIYHGETTSVAQRAGTYPSEPWSVENDTLPSGGYRELKTVLWANYDVLNPDGTIYLSASEPQPVYI